jgi:hypothetical protein
MRQRQEVKPLRRKIEESSLSRRASTFFALVIAIAAIPPATALGQSGRGQNRGGDTESQRTQQADQMQQQLDQQQQQMQMDQDIQRRTLALQELPLKIWLQERERERINQLLRENFRRHYSVIRQNAEELVQLTSTLESDVENNGDSSLGREMQAKVARVGKLAHDIRASMAGQRLPKYKPARTLKASGKVTLPGDRRGTEWLSEKTNAASLAATKLRNAVADYLATNNEHTVSNKFLAESR